MKPLIGLGSRVVLGMLLLLAGLEKVSEPELFVRSISNYHLLPAGLESLAALVVPCFEIVVGGCLIVGLLSRSAALLAGLLSLGFGVFVSSALLRGLNVDCGCFAGTSKVSWLHLALDIAMIAMAWVVLRGGGGDLSLDRKLSMDKDRAAGLSRLSALLGGVLFLGNAAYLGSQGLPVVTPPPAEVSEAMIGPADLVFSPPMVELGTVPQEAGTEVTVSYENVGTSEARIVDVKSSCNCTVPSLSKRTLLPGESAELTVTYTPGPNTGEVHQTVLVYLEGQEEPVLLHIQGQIDRMVDVIPGVVELPVGVAKTIRIESRREGYVPEVTAFSSPVEGLKVEVLDQAADGSAQVKVTAGSELPEPPGESNVWPLKIRLASGPYCTLYLKGKATP